MTFLEGERRRLGPSSPSLPLTLNLEKSDWMEHCASDSYPCQYRPCKLPLQAGAWVSPRTGVSIPPTRERPGPVHFRVPPPPHPGWSPSASSRSASAERRRNSKPRQAA